ncbi:sensor histidine kinase [Gottschalkia acidurici]|nr:ATP-binding protein [Gottschalkia acidurici]
MIIFLLIQFVVLITLNHLGIELDNSFNDGLTAHTIILPITIAISRLLPINIVFNYVNKDNRVFKYLSLNIFIILISLLAYWYIDVNGVLKNIIAIAVVLTWVILVNFVLLKNGLKNELEEQQLRIYEEYLPVIDELISEIRKRQHEFDNHIQALKMITVTSEDYESVIGSMKHYMRDLEVTNDLKDLIKIDNKILAGFLYNKIKNAEKLDIQFDIIIQDYEFNTGLKDYEVVEVMGNLINNAFETNIENNSVILIISKEKDMNVIEIRNKHPYLKKENLDKIFSKGFSTKSSTGRGYGLYNVKKIVEKYNGKIEILNKSYRDENYVVFKVLFVRK